MEMVRPKTYEEDVAMSAKAAEEFAAAKELAALLRPTYLRASDCSEGGGWIETTSVVVGEFRIGIVRGVDVNAAILAILPKDLENGEWPDWEIDLAASSDPTSEGGEALDGALTDDDPPREADPKSVWDEIEERRRGG